VIAANAVVNGTLTFERDVELFVHESAKIGSVTGADAQALHRRAPAKEQ
jgi:hypothetical protein